MQVIVDADYLELLRNDEQKPQSGEINPFTGKRVQTVSMDVVKKLISLPKEERETLMKQLKSNYSKRT